MFWVGTRRLKCEQGGKNTSKERKKALHHAPVTDTKGLDPSSLAEKLYELLLEAVKNFS